MVINVDYEESDERMQTILQIPYDITWTDLELLVSNNGLCHLTVL